MRKTMMFEGANKKEMSGVVWTPDEKTVGVVQIVHGMTEHMERYADLAEVLTLNGFVVAGFDLRGHGVHSTSDELAVFELGDWSNSLTDIYSFANQLHKKYPGLPHFILGFSLGSFLVRDYLQHYHDVDGAILIGTGYQPGIVLKALSAVIGNEIKKVGYEGTTPLVKKLSFETYNKSVGSNCTQADWLCADAKELDKYLNDPLCKDGISAGLFKQLINGMETVGTANIYKWYKKDTPVLLLSGFSDPVGNNGKGVKRVFDQMNFAGMQHVAMELFPGRHDLLHEEYSGSAEKTRQKIVSWLLKELYHYNNPTAPRK